MGHESSTAAAFVVSPGSGRGWKSLPPDAEVGAFIHQLNRALHTIECRELGPVAARQRYGQFADVQGGRVFLAINADQLSAQHPGHEELHDLLRTVRERGPAVDVTLTSPRA